MSKKTNNKSKAKPATKSKAKPAAKKAKPAPAKKAKAAPAKKAPAKKVVAKKAAPAKKAPVKKVVAKAPVKKVAAKVVAKAPAKTVVAKPAVKTPAKAVVAKPEVVKAPPVVKASKKESAKNKVEKPQLPPRNEIPAPPKERPVIGRPAPFNRRPEPALNRPQKPQEDSGKTRYADSELEEFRAIINKKLEEARRELMLLQAQMTAANEHGTDDTASTFKILEDGSDSLAKEEAGQLASRQKKFIEQLENAMVRIENKTYGVCRVTGKLIPKERLRAVPHTTQSIEAKLNQYRD
ncbi:MAG: TraR/DksA family transcriptional regulator [Bacteroidetes bacterium]|nr:TraR/DksA family transcriptional regulator [Bacteroidota bacterium]MBP6657061.1 TraR/DksA family transcriptional regulator [Bacteroidia bacterium]